MLRLADKNQTYPLPFMVGGERTVFNIRGMSIADQFDIIGKLSEIGADGFLDTMIETLCPYIESIDGYDDKPADVLRQLETQAHLIDIMREFRTWISLDDHSVKNFVSSSEQRIQESAGSAEKNVEQVEEPALTEATYKPPEGEDNR